MPEKEIQYRNTKIDYKNLQYTTDGDANFHGISDGKMWIMRVQCNGELSINQQEKIIKQIIQSLKETDV